MNKPRTYFATTKEKMTYEARYIAATESMVKAIAVLAKDDETTQHRLKGLNPDDPEAVRFVAMATSGRCDIRSTARELNRNPVKLAARFRSFVDAVTGLDRD